MYSESLLNSTQYRQDFGLALGGVLKPREGGIPVTAAEAGVAEWYVPLDQRGSEFVIDTMHNLKTESGDTLKETLDEIKQTVMATAAASANNGGPVTGVPPEITNAPNKGTLEMAKMLSMGILEGNS